jgi:hypothetical protein
VQNIYARVVSVGRTWAAATTYNVSDSWVGSAHALIPEVYTVK